MSMRVQLVKPTLHVDEDVCNESIHTCEYCDKVFKNSKELSKHIKYSCQTNYDRGLQELIRLLKKGNATLQEQTDALQHRIEQLSNKLQIPKANAQNNQHVDLQNNSVPKNMSINNYDDTNYKHSKDTDYKKYIEACDDCVKYVIERVDVNKDHPENMNIYISSINKTDYLINGILMTEQHVSINCDVI
jgi:uncharacterized C2H2 Zn-finger protein